MKIVAVDAGIRQIALTNALISVFTLTRSLAKNIIPSTFSHCVTLLTQAPMSCIGNPCDGKKKEVQNCEVEGHFSDKSKFENRSMHLHYLSQYILETPLGHCYKYLGLCLYQLQTLFAKTLLLQVLPRFAIGFRSEL